MDAHSGGHAGRYVHPGQPDTFTPTPTSTPAVTSRPASSLPAWLAAPRMPVARDALAVVAGPDGRVYAVGGSGGPGAAASDARVYNPDTATWARRAPLPSARFGLAAAFGGDGRLYAIGGTNARGIALSTVAAYTPGTNTWAAVPPLPVAATGLAAVGAPNGIIYAIGGTSVTGTLLATVQAYDVTSGTWSLLAPMPTARFGLAAALGSDGRIYALGGCAGVACLTPLSTVEAYNITSNTWTAAPPLPVARFDLAAAASPDGRLYAIGGFTPTATGRVDAYSPGSGTWSPAAGLTMALGSLGAATGVDGRIYALGGITAPGTKPVSLVVAYGPAIMLNPAHGRAGTRVSITGKNFAPGDIVRIYWGNPAVDIVLTTTASSITGTLPSGLRVRVPSGAPAGPYRITLVDMASLYSVSALFTVTSAPVAPTGPGGAPAAAHVPSLPAAVLVRKM